MKDFDILILVTDSNRHLVKVVKIKAPQYNKLSVMGMY